MGENFPTEVGPRARAAFLGINRDDDALRAEFFRGLAHELRIEHRRGVDADLVGAGVEQSADVFECAYASTHRQWNKDFTRHLFHHMHRWFRGYRNWR